MTLVHCREKHIWNDLIIDRKSTRLNSSHLVISYAVFCLKKKKISNRPTTRKVWHATSLGRLRLGTSPQNRAANPPSTIPVTPSSTRQPAATPPERTRTRS